MANSGISGWFVAVGTLLGGLSGIAAVVTIVRDSDSPIAKLILENNARASANQKVVAQAYEDETAREDRVWGRTIATDTPEAFAAYAAAYPAGRYVADAVAHRNSLNEQRAWNVALSQNTKEAYDLYLSAYETGPHATAARTNRAQLEGKAAQGNFSLDALGSAVRPLVIAGRQAAVEADDAQRRARRSEPGYFSEYRDAEKSAWVRTNMFGGKFEGKLGTAKNWVGKSWPNPVLGVWVFDQESQGVGESARLVVPKIVRIRGRQTSFSDGRVRLIGELKYRDGRVYEGEFSMNIGREAQLEGLGALWAPDGSLIGSGGWRKDILAPT